MRRITLDKNHEIGPECQILVWTETGLFPEFCLVQPLPSFEDRYSIKVAACLARGQHGRVPARLLNTGKIPIKLHKGTVIATLEPIKDEPIELSCEAESVKERIDTVRSISQGSHQQIIVGSHVKFQPVINAQSSYMEPLVVLGTSGDERWFTL